MEPYTHRYSKLERVHFGVDAAATVAAEAALVAARRVFILSTRSLAREGRLLAGIAAALGERCAGQFTAISAHSPSEEVLAAARAARTAHADLVVAVGGGSVADAAKLVVTCLIEGLQTLAQLQALQNFAAVDQSRAPDRHGQPTPRLVAVPTTLSAAEFNWGASFTDRMTRHKWGVGHALMVPIAVVLDPKATLPTPDPLFLGSGINALDHAAERLASPHGTPFSDATATVAITLLGRALRRLKHERDNLAARSEAQSAAWLSVAGQAQGVTIGASHGIGRVLATEAGLPHGFASCVLLPWVMRWNAPVNGARQTRIAAALDRPEQSAGDAIAALVAELGLPRRLSDLGVDEAIFAEVARKVEAEGRVPTNPRPLQSAEDVIKILRLAW